jgi:4,5:9,10-diseco-3-hydroxy-5,9,17-trioxoandrosta-1(10),2-diene-4-oate hydrolase
MNPVFPEVPRFTLDALGVHTSYLMLGEGNSEPVILLHGMSTAADSFRETMYGLADQFWLLAPDIPGFGFSDGTRPYTYAHLVEWLAGFRMALDLAPGALIGHSFGGVLAVAYVLAYPEDVTRLLLAAPSILSHNAYPDFLKRAAVSLGLVDLGSAISQSPLWVKRQIKSPFYAPERQDESVWQRRLQDYALARASASVLKASAFLDLRPALNQIEQPVCLVWGENDPVVPPQDARKLQDILPDAEVHLLPECGHVPILEQPALFQATAREFLAVHHQE